MATTNVNFVQLTTTVSGASVPVALAAAPSQAAILTSQGGGVTVDRFAVDLARLTYAKNGMFALALAASTPVTVDLTATGTAATSAAGDVTFATADVLIFTNTGAQAVTVSAGASNGFAMGLTGTTPAFVVPAGAGFGVVPPFVLPIAAASHTVDSTHKNIKFDPGGSPATIACSVGGS